MADDVSKFEALVRKLDAALTPGGHENDVQVVPLSKWEIATLIAAIQQAIDG